MQSTWSRTLSGVVVVLLIVAAQILMGPLSVTGQQANNPGQQVRTLNNQLLQVYARLNALPNPQAAAAIAEHSQAAAVIQERSAALERLIQQNPSEALSLAFSEDLLSRLRKAFPESAGLLESEGSWEGLVEYQIEDSLDMNTHRSIVRISVGKEMLNVRFASGEPETLESRAILRVWGLRAGTELAAADGTVTGVLPESAAMCTPMGEQRSLVLLLTLPGVTPSPMITPASVSEIFFGNSGRSVSEFWKENSYGATTAAGDVLGWYTLDANYTCAQTGPILDAAIRLIDSSVDFRQYSRIFLVLAGISGSCGWAGTATVGCSSLSSPGDGNFTASTAWMLSDFFTQRDTAVRLSIHEGGHNLGLHHASARDFGAETLGAPGMAGTLTEYGDEFSAMGASSLAHYAAPHKAKLGWITSDMQTVTESGSFSLQPTELTGALHALKISRGTESNNRLWVEYRAPVGIFDSTLVPEAFGGGLIHYEDSSTGSRTHLLDFTPQTASWSDPALAVGQTWTDPYTNLSVTIHSATPEALNVNVEYGPIPCMQALPTVNISPLNPSVHAGDSVNYEITVRNNDSSSCAPRNFNTDSLIPDSWTTSFSESSFTLSPTSSQSLTMTKMVPPTTPPATYPVNALVANDSAWIEATANVTIDPLPCIEASPGMTISPSNASAYAGDPVTYTLVVTNKDSASCAPRVFDLSSVFPTDWTTAFSQSSLTLSPSLYGSVTMTKIVPAATSAAVYAVNARVTKGSSWVEVLTPLTVLPSACVEALPAVVMSPASATAYAGDLVTYTIMVTNRDSASCAPRNFNVSSILPASWTTTLSQSALTLSPSLAASVTMIKLVPPATPAAAYTVNTMISAGSSSVEASAGVTVQPSSCVEASPALVMSPASASAYPGDLVTHTVVVTNNDSASCAPRSFNLSSLLPANWATTFSQTSLMLSPTSSGSVTMSKAIPSNAAAAAYSVKAQVSGGSSFSEAVAEVKVLMQPMTIAVSVLKTDAKNATIAAKVMQGTAVSGASVQFKVVGPDNAVTIKKATTDPSGQALWNYRVGPKDPKGSYQVTAQATSGTQTADSGAVSFLVQ